MFSLFIRTMMYEHIPQTKEEVSAQLGSRPSASRNAVYLLCKLLLKETAWYVCMCDNFKRLLLTACWERDNSL